MSETKPSLTSLIYRINLALVPIMFGSLVTWGTWATVTILENKQNLAVSAANQFDDEDAHEQEVRINTRMDAADNLQNTKLESMLETLHEIRTDVAVLRAKAEMNDANK